MKDINTFIVGVQKAGTTSLYELLGRHPEINAPFALKDDHLFSSEPDSTDKIAKYYSGNTMPVQLHCGVNYIHFIDSIQELARYNSEAKIIISLRDPVQRFLSAYRYNQQRGIEKRNWQKIVEEEQKGYENRYEKANFDYLAHGYYASKIKKCFELFSEDSVHILLFEEWINDYQAINSLYDFLGVDSLELEFSKLNATGVSRFPVVSELIHGNGKMKKILTPVWRKFPYGFRKSVIDSIDRLNFVPSAKPEEHLELRNFLINHYDTEKREVSQLLGKDLMKLWK